MRIIKVNANEAGQRMTKLLLKYFDKAPASFIYKMLRKKNIVLDGKKADGTEMLALGSEIKLFLAEETIKSFRSCESDEEDETEKKALPTLKRDMIVYEDEDVLIINKPFGVLSQKAEKDDVSLVEMLIGYMTAKGELSKRDLETFHPSICNRLDRNTQGLVVAGKTLKGLQTMTELIRSRSVRKFYACVVKGEVDDKPVHVKAFLTKDEKTNKVTVSQVRRSREDEQIETKYRAIMHLDGYTLLEVELLTGKTHQIRAQLAAAGHPIVGDMKYGAKRINDEIKKATGLDHQLLLSMRLEFPKMTGEVNGLSEKTIRLELPEEFQKVIAYCG